MLDYIRNEHNTCKSNYPESGLKETQEDENSFFLSTFTNNKSGGYLWKQITAQYFENTELSDIHLKAYPILTVLNEIQVSQYIKCSLKIIIMFTIKVNDLNNYNHILPSTAKYYPLKHSIH